VRSLRARLLAAFLVVAAASLGTVAVAVLLVGPGYFAEAMGHMPGDPMGQAMGEATRAAFEAAMRQALLAATIIAIVTAGTKLPKGLAQDVITIPACHEAVLPIVATIPVQLLSYYIAV
jgi:hypothetical protein